MSVFAVSFRLGDRSNYTEVWTSVVSAIRSQASGPVWEETSSFFIFESSKTASEISHAVYIGSLFTDTQDIMVVTNLSVKAHASRGALAQSSKLEGLMSRR